MGRGTDCIAKPRRVFNGSKAFDAADSHLEGAVGLLQCQQVLPCFGGSSGRKSLVFGEFLVLRRVRRQFLAQQMFLLLNQFLPLQALGYFLHVERTQQPEEVRNAFHPTDPPIRNQPLQLPLGGIDDCRVQELTEFHPA